MAVRSRPIRVLVAKPGLDGHEMGAKLVARVLREAGMEVVYTGPRQTAEMVAAAALEEDVDVIGLSFLSGSHKEHCRQVFKHLAELGMDDVIVVAGGIIPQQDVPTLTEIGVHKVFGPDTTITDIIEYVEGAVDRSD